MRSEMSRSVRSNAPRGHSRRSFIFSRTTVLCRSSASEVSVEGSPGTIQGEQVATLLLGDIGGTNARFELVDADIFTGNRIPGRTFTERLPTKDYATFEGALEHFFEKAGKQSENVASCCLAVAGPVVDNVCQMTNLRWSVDGDKIQDELGVRTAVLNDFVAVGYAIPRLKEEDVVVINEGQLHPGGPIAVLGPGTGLGEVQLMWDTGYQDYVAWASEGSHAGFAPRGELQRELLEFAEAELELPCEVEHVACGVGLGRIYRFLSQKHGSPEEGLTPAQITERGMRTDGSCPVCSQTIDLFLQIVGAEAGAMALRSMATGGVYIAGGIPPKLLDRVAGGELRDAFLNSRSRFSKIAKRFPLYVLREEAGLRGVFNYAMALAQERR